MIYLIILLCAWFIGLIFLMLQLKRNELIAKKAMSIHDYIFVKDSSRNYLRSYEEISDLLKQDKSVEMWDNMLWKFWKPINSFYKNTPFEKI